MKTKKFEESLFIKMPKELKEKIAKKAEENFKNVSEYVRDLIVENLKESE